MSVFTLAIPCLTTSNLPWFMDLTFQVPMQYCSYSIGLYFHHLSHPQLSVVFALAPSLRSVLELFIHWSTVAFWAPTDLGEFIFQCPIFLPFHAVYGVLKARILKWFAIPFSSGPHSVRPLHHGSTMTIQCSTWMHSQKWQNDLCSFPRQTIQYHGNPSLCPSR